MCDDDGGKAGPELWHKVGEELLCARFAANPVCVCVCLRVHVCKSCVLTLTLQKGGPQTPARVQRRGKKRAGGETKRSGKYLHKGTRAVETVSEGHSLESEEEKEAKVVKCVARAPHHSLSLVAVVVAPREQAGRGSGRAATSFFGCMRACV
jgi:hypothetical protein